MAERQKQLQEQYQQSMHKQREFRLQEIKNTFRFTLEKEVTDEEASFINDFCVKYQFDVMDKIENEGETFLLSMREMLEEKKHEINDNINQNKTKKHW